MWKKVKRVLYFLLLFAMVLVLGIGISAIVYKDRIVRQLISEANKQINTPIRVDEVNLELFEKFPEVAIKFSKVTVEESWPDSTDPLLIAQRVFITLNPFRLFRGDYEINDIYIEDAEFFIRIDPVGKNNFTIFSKKTTSEKSADTLYIDLKNIVLSNADLHYHDEYNSQEHHYFIRENNISVKLDQSKYDIEVNGNLRSEFIRINGRDFLKNKEAQVNSSMQYDPESRHLYFLPSEIKIRNSAFTFEGEVLSDEEPHIDLHIEGIDTDIQSLITFLPEDQVKQLGEYESKGEVYFSMELKGFTRKNVNTKIEFGLRGAELSHPKLRSKATQVYLTGIFLAPSFREITNSDLKLSDIKGKFGAYPFEGNLVLKNLSDPTARFDLKGTFEMDELIVWLPDTRLSGGSGLVNCHIVFDGRINDLKSKYTSRKVNTSGEVEFIDVVLTFEQDFPLATTINGNFIFTQNDLAINNTKIQTGESSWTMNGLFRNILPFLLFKNQSIGIEADINADFINFEELLPSRTAGKISTIKFGISPYLVLDFNCEVRELRYKRFEASDLSGNLRVKDSKVFARNIEFNSMGGKLQFAGLVNASQENIAISSTSRWENLAIDSVFYVFNNFNQDWLIAENLKGNAFADVMTDMIFSRDLVFLSDSLISDISISIVDGELNDFQPMIDLEDFVDDENLAHLKFSELRNDIHVENRKIYLPQMEVRSNVSNILVSGSHTFDQEIDYRVVVPLKTLGKNKNEDMFGAVEDDGSGSKLHLKIIGTTDDYEIKYDAAGVKNKVVADLKNEVNELKDAFRKKDRKVEEVELNEEEFFEWEEDTIRINIPRLRRH